LGDFWVVRNPVLALPAAWLLLLLEVAGVGSIIDGDGWGGVGLSVLKTQPLNRAPHSQTRSIPLSFSLPATPPFLSPSLSLDLPSSL